ncbi:MAG: hypothetical protein J6M18_01570 [Actinomycetaceae bacterium]|nr:hypothetical protein [Actinomycetaceae bacterium]
MAHSTQETLLALLDDISQEVEQAKTKMFDSATVLVDKALILDLVDAARQALPRELTHAEELLDKARKEHDRSRDKARDIVDEARAEASRIVKEAKEKAARLVEKDSITITAKREAQKIIDEASSQADKLKRGADEYSDASLVALEGHIDSFDDDLSALVENMRVQLDAMASQIKSGRNVIAQRSDDYSPTSVRFPTLDEAVIDDEDVVISSSGTDGELSSFPSLKETREGRISQDSIPTAVEPLEELEEK